MMILDDGDEGSGDDSDDNDDDDVYNYEKNHLNLVQMILIDFSTVMKTNNYDINQPQTKNERNSSNRESLTYVFRYHIRRTFR